MRKSPGTAKVRILFILICSFGMVMPLSSSFANVVINEIMYHPVSDLDEDDFVELYNTGAEAVNLEGWRINGLSLTFGSGDSIGPNAYLVLSKDANHFFATYGFSPDYVFDGNLQNDGEILEVIDAGQNVVDVVDYGELPPWPVTPDGLGPSLERIDPTLDGDTPRNWRASIAAVKHTAKAINSVNASGLPPWITNVQRDTAQPGLPITVRATVQDAATVSLKYVINFDANVVISMLDNGLSGDGAAGDGVYGATIPAQPLNTLVRYRIDASGATGSMGFPRTDDTVTYSGTVTENDASIVTGMPVFHWFVDPNAYNAAFVHLYTYDTEPALVYYGGTLYDGVRFRVRGSSSRGTSWIKKNWKFYFPQGHDFFAPELINIPADQFNMNASYSDKTYMREFLSFNMLADYGTPASKIFHVRLYQNGQFYGLYAYLEQPDDDFIQRYDLDEEGSLYEAKGAGVNYADCRYYPLADIGLYYDKHRPVDGDYNDLYNLLNGLNNLTGQARKNFIFDNIDIPRTLNYLAILSAMHDNDCVAKNYYLYRDTSGTQRWYLLPWDKDLTWGRNYNSGGVLNDDIWADVDSISGRTNVSPSHPLFGNYTHEKYDYLWNRLIGALYDINDANGFEMRDMYYRRLRTLMDEELQTSSTPYEERKIENRIDEITAFLDTEGVMDKSLWAWWGQYQTVVDATQILKESYLAIRRTHLFGTHRVAGEIPEAQTSQPPIIISEIMYNPLGGENNEFLELFNPSTTESVDLTDWRLDGVALTFPPGTVLLPRHYLAVVKNDVQFRATYGSGKYVAAQYKGNLDNVGEKLTLKDKYGNVIDEVLYDDQTPWPTLPDTNGYSLELIDVNQSNNHCMNWAASASPGGTPCASNSMAGTSTFVPDLWVNEVLPLNSSINTDEMGEYAPWIEIYNNTTSSINLGGMFLTDDLNNMSKWQIPAGTSVNGGQWKLFWADGETAEGPLHTNFLLNSAGGFVGLYTATGDVVDYLDYGPLTYDVSHGRYPDGSDLLREFVTPTPLEENYVIISPLILNEYSAVADNRYLKDDGSDTYWGRIMGNGGDWFELVVTHDHLDIRGWQLIISDDTGGSGQTIQTLTLTSNSLWSNLRSGTIITVSEKLADNTSNYDPENGFWWINIQAKTGASGTYITPANFNVSNNNWQLTIKDNNSMVVFGPAGEGIKPVSAIGNDEVFKLEEDPGYLISERSNYNDGTSSTFGAPNLYAAGTLVQDFNELRNIPDVGEPTPNPPVWSKVPTATGIAAAPNASITMIAATASDPAGVEYYFNNVTDPTHDSGWQNSTYYKDKNLSANTAYTYRVKTRDKAAAQNETVWSLSASAITATQGLNPVSGTVTTNTSSSARTSATFSHTVASGNNRLLVVCVMFRGNSTINTIFYGSTPLIRNIRTASGSSSGCGVEIWCMVNPPVGTNNVLVNFGSSVDPSAVTAVNFTGVDQSFPIGASSGAYSSTGTSVTTSITTREINSLIFGAATGYGGDTNPYTPGSGITEMWDTETGTSTTSDNGLWGGMRTATTLGAYTFNTTAAVSDDWAIAAVEIKAAPGGTPPGQASSPGPSNGATNIGVTTDLGWTAGSGGTSHDVYFGTVNPPPYQGNQTGTTFDTGTMTTNKTYYWRIDEKNAGYTTTGTVWSFTTVGSPPGKATSPSPSNSASDISITTDLSWTAGSGATSHDVYFGTVSPGTFQGNQTGTTFDTGTMANNTTYYWRIDEKNAGGTTTGDAWSFTTIVAAPDKATVPSPSNGATGIGITTDLGWAAGARATSHLVYFGSVSPGTYRGEQAGTTFDTGTMVNGTTYYWRIDEKNTGGTITGDVWSFTTIARRTLTSSSTTGGDVTTPGEGAFQYDNGTEVNLVATPDANYHFVNWTGPVADPNSASTTILMNADYNVIANLAINTFTLTYAADANGNISGTSPQTIDYGSSGNAVTAVPNTGYHFVKWSDDVTANPRTDTNVTANISVTAQFAIDIFTLTYAADANGNISGTSPQTVDYGTNGTAVTAVPNTGFHFVKWSDDVTANPRTDTNITANISVTAQFAIDIFTLTYAADANGNISGTNPQTIDYGSSGNAVTAVPNTGYHFVKWSDDVTANPRTDTNITANISVTAEFAIDTHTVTFIEGPNGSITGTLVQVVNYGSDCMAVTAVPNANYHFTGWTGSHTGTENPLTITNVTADMTITANFAIDTHTVTFVEGPNGHITGTLVQVVNHGSDCTAVTAVPNANYHFTGWTGSHTGTENPLTITNVTGDMTITSNFAIDTFTLSYIPGANGTITGTSPQTVDYGTNGTAVTAEPNTGYHFVKWSDDVTANPRTDTSVTTNISVTANFQINTYTIIASAGTNGSVSPTSIEVTYGDNQEFTATPGVNYAVDKWSLDSIEVQTGGNTFMLTNITTIHTVSVSFIILPPSQASNPTPANNDVNVNITTAISWTAGQRAASHNVYFGTESIPPLVSSNYLDITYYPSQLSNGTTYYWRIDENNAGGTTTGTIWSFTTIPLPGQASLPNPANEANNFSVNDVLGWTAGSNATSHIVYFGTVSPGTLIGEQSGTTYDPPGAMEVGVTYYWRIDEKNAGGTTTGIVWSFTPIVKIMPLGDSITMGSGSTYTGGYREPLYTSLINSNCGFDFVGSASNGNFADPNHEGHYGWRADEILNGRISEPNAGKLTDWLPVSQPDVILLHIGTNDITQGNQDANEVNSILNIIDAYETTNSKDIYVILALIIDRVPNTQATTIYNNDLNSMATNRIANGDHIIIVNMQNELNYSTDMADIVHPTDIGYAKMANVWYHPLVYVINGQRTLNCSSTEGGSVTQPGEGTFLYDDGTNVNITATPDANYHFVNWTGTGVAAGKVTDPNSASSTIRMDGAYTLVANFSIDTFLVTANAGANGTVDPTSTSKDYGSSQVFTATPATNYTVDKWQLDGVDVQTGGNTYTLNNITADHNITVSFKLLSYTVTFIADDHGSITGTLVQTIGYGGNCMEVNAVADANYRFTGWTGSYIGTDNPLTITNVTANMTITANFTIVHTVTFIAGTNGNITGTLVQVVNHGANCTEVNAVANANYRFTGWTDSYVGTDNPLTVTNVMDDMTITANFAIDTFTLTYTAGAHGSISGTSPQIVGYGQNGTAVTAVPNSGYHFVNWSDASTANPRTDVNVIANISVTANFSNLYTVTATAGSNGSIDPQGVLNKTYGSSEWFDATPQPGYEVLKWQIDGINAWTGVFPFYYIENIAADHSVNVTFRVESPPVRDVEILGSWTQGLTHVKETGSNRGLVFIAHGVHDNDMNLISVTYGQQSMTKIMERNYQAYTGRAYVVAFFLKEAGIAAASNSSFVPVWANDMNSFPPMYSSVFLTNVNQSSPIGATTVSVVSDGNTITAPAISVDPHSMVILGVTSRISGSASYTLNNGFTEGIDQTIPNILSGVTGHKEADGATQIIPSASLWGGTFVYRQIIIGFEVKSALRTLTVSSSAGGTVTQPGTGSFNFADDFTVDLYAAPDENYHFVNWTGSAVDATRVFDDNYSAEANSPAGYIYMDADYTLMANFALDTRMITASAGEHGSIDPNGAITVDYGYGRMFNATPEPGYAVAAWYLDGNSVQVWGNTYTLDNITENHTVHVTFTLARTISGTIQNAGVALNDVNILGMGVLTDTNGFYTAIVPYGWSGTITPVKAGYTFDPNDRVYTNTTSDVPDQNFVAFLETDFDESGYVDLNDIAIFCDNWLQTGEGDFNDDGIVNFLDFIEFGLVW